ncbi:MAG: glycosyltransferase [Flavobacterium sp.]
MMQSKSKVITVLINRLNSGGAEKVCVVLCNELVKRGYQVELWVVGLDDTILSKKIDKKINITNFKKESVRSSIFPFSYHLFKKSPKLMLVFNTELCILAILLKFFFFKKTKIIFRSINTLSVAIDTNTIYRKKIVYPIIKKFLKSTDFVVAQSEGMKEDLIRNYDITPSKIATIPNPAIVLEKRAIDLNPDSKVNELVFVGRLVNQKGLPLLFEALRIVVQKVDTVYLTIVGEGPEMQNLKNLAEDLQLSKVITFVGFDADVNQYMTKAKATVLSSYFEGFPNVLVESISLGIPVISFDCPSGPRDIIEPNVNGILVPFLNVELFANAILEVLNEDVKFEREKIIASGHKFSLMSVVDRYEEIL